MPKVLPGAWADPDNPLIKGGHANFGCRGCTLGRYPFGIHVVEEGGKIVVHDDTVSPWLSPFSFFNFNPIYLIEHGTIDLIGGHLGTNVFPQ